MHSTVIDFTADGRVVRGNSIRTGNRSAAARTQCASGVYYMYMWYTCRHACIKRYNKKVDVDRAHNSRLDCCSAPIAFYPLSLVALQCRSVVGAYRLDYLSERAVLVHGRKRLKSGSI